ncbi:uncharacterized protein LOC111802045 [Cucurbita pepo subsp. pepo]|uniref:uncharacterized protein LOC111802045 n=1 Tax=Cucurbita pepo subsp. pepo TaxID=3664 RepID=UPI000C9D8830|nr:uncharacterized protein LOC111802045 [Cucurbita pepo subsp. pepo]
MAKMHSVSFSMIVLVAVFGGQAKGGGPCDKADHVQLCQTAVKGATEPEAALKAAIEHLIVETERAREEAAKLGKMEPLDVCKTNFNDAIRGLKESLNHLKTKDKHSLKTKLSAALTFYVTCDDTLAEGRVVQLASDVLTTDAMLRQLAGVCLYLATLT